MNKTKKMAKTAIPIAVFILAIAAIGIYAVAAKAPTSKTNIVTALELPKDTTVIVTANPPMTPAPTISETEISQSAIEYPQGEIEMLAKTVYGEARGCTPDEQRLVLWCIFQRVDSPEFPNTVTGVVTKPRQFVGYSAANPVWDDIAEVCQEEWLKWKSGEHPPTLAPYATKTPYYFFDGDGRHNWYREQWKK